MMALGWQPVGETDNVGQRFVRELDALSLDVLGGTLLLVIAMAGVVAMASWGIDRLAERARRAFGPLHGLVDRLAARVRVLLGLAAALASLWPLLVRAPFVVVTVFLAIAIIVARVAPGLVQDFVAGFMLARRRVFGEGDAIDVGGIRGRVDHIGARETVLSMPDGGHVYLPNRQIAGAAVTVAALAGASRIRTSVVRKQRVGAAQLEAVRRRLQASAFRLPRGAVVVASDGLEVRIEVETWASSARDVLDRRLAAIAQAELDRLEPSHPTASATEGSGAR